MALEVWATGALIIWASLWGTLTRMGLTALNTYAGQSIDPNVWAQGVGCLVMGWVTAASNRKVLDQWYKPLFPMMATGYCGSVTSFSVWAVGVFEAFADYHHYHRGGLHNVMDALTQTAATLAVSFAAFWTGECISKTFNLEELEKRRLPQQDRLPTEATQAKQALAEKDLSASSPAGSSQNVVHWIAIVVGLVFWIGAALLCGLYAPFRHVTYALVLSPPGALVRWQLARLNPSGSRPLSRHWPFGTYFANQLAVLIYCAGEVAMYFGYIAGPTGKTVSSKDACNALYGLQAGFCGTLSTISTLITELVAMKPPRKAFAYVFFSWASGVVFCILVLGSTWWSSGMQGGCKPH
ncbi:hypothetical protein MYAM1_004074 [Malassezia yamatoensis]|uniref:Uncharacterized protein n=1 Tax=Malassezia yamatoensis TaxID=253288 RepID=A0AAJ5YX32_9BASI|nr:hypothetical protein MYAM1_004074 [Malassezia yamatoensis]